MLTWDELENALQYEKMINIRKGKELDLLECDIKILKQEIDLRFCEIAKLTKILLQRDQEAKVRQNLLQGKLEAKEIEIENNQSIIHNKDVELISIKSHLEAALMEKDELSRQLREKDWQLTNATHALSVTQNDMKTQQTNAEQALSLKQSEIDTLNFYIEAIHNSTSWRITKPLRFIKRLTGPVNNVK